MITMLPFFILTTLLISTFSLHKPTVAVAVLFYSTGALLPVILCFCFANPHPVHPDSEFIRSYCQLKNPLHIILYLSGKHHGTHGSLSHTFVINLNV